MSSSGHVLHPQQVVEVVLHCFSLTWVKISLPAVVWSILAPALLSSILQLVLSRDVWIKFVKLLAPAEEKYSSLLPAEPQPHWHGFVSLRPTIVFRLILASAESRWEWCISSSASIKAARCGWSQTRLWRDLSNRLPKRSDWIHLLTNEKGLQIVHLRSYTSTC